MVRAGESRPASTCRRTILVGSTSSLSIPVTRSSSIPSSFSRPSWGGASSTRDAISPSTARGNAYVIGETLSAGLGTAGAFAAAQQGASDVFVTKLDHTGTTVLFTTYLGGSGDDVGRGIAIDDGGIYVTGPHDVRRFSSGLTPASGSRWRERRLSLEARPRGLVSRVLDLSRGQRG